MKSSKMKGAITFGAYKSKGWSAAVASHPHRALYGKIQWHVYRDSYGPGMGKGYCAVATGTGQRRSSQGYRYRNEGKACAVTAKRAVIKAVESYLKAGALKRRGGVRVNPD